MADIKTGTLRIGSNNLVLQDDAARGSLAPAYSASSTYAVGDMVLKDGQLYECNTAISTAEAWTAAHWTAVTVGSELSDLKSEISQMSGLSEDAKQALLQIAEKVAYIDEDGQDYYDDLYNALYAVTAIHLDAQSIMLTSIGSTQQLTATTTPEGGSVTWVSSDTSIATVSSNGLVTSTGYGACTITASSGSVSASCAVAVSQVTLTSIAADYQQSGTVYDTASLNSLKSDLTVTATYSDSSTATVTEYTLSGTLTVGTSTVTVAYGGKTDTFEVTVSEYVDPRVLLYNWDLTNSLTDTVEEKTATISGATQDSSGVHLTAIANHADFSNILAVGRTVEVDVASYSRQGTAHGRFIMVTGGDGLIYNKSGYWALYLSGGWESSGITDPTFFNGKTVVVKFTSAESGTLISVYCDNELIVEKVETATIGLMMLGSNNSNSAYNSTFTAVRVYEGV